MRKSRSLSGAILLLLMVGGCKTTTAPVTTGSVQASLSMTGVDLDADGVTMTIDGGSEQRVSAGGSATFSKLNPGGHVVQIGDVADNCQVDGGLSRTATVTAGQTTNVAFSVTCEPPTGSVLASLSMTGVDLDADGVTMTIDGGSEQTVNAGGSATFSDLSPGDHVVQIGDVADNCQVDGGLSRTATVTAGQTTNVSFAVTCDAIVVVSGNWDFIASFNLGATACTLEFSLILLEAQGSFSGTYDGLFACPELGAPVPTNGLVANGTVVSNQVVFDFDTPAFHHSGTIASSSMNGSATYEFDVATPATWSATRIGASPLQATARSTGRPVGQLVRKALERIPD